MRRVQPPVDRGTPARPVSRRARATTTPTKGSPASAPKTAPKTVAKTVAASAGTVRATMAAHIARGLNAGTLRTAPITGRQVSAVLDLLSRAPLAAPATPATPAPVPSRTPRARPARAGR